jgi:GT2 family glycosyltransferase
LSALEKCGALDERLFMYGEDVDICLRLRQVGYRVVATAKTAAWHRHTEIRMTDRRPRPYRVLYQHRNQVYLAKKHCSSAVRRSYYLGLIKRLPRQLAYFALREHSIRLSYIYLEALWDGFMNKMGKTKYVQ